ncbi:hypothetical protein HRI_001112300 [Hibiscus trionum]|uniref:CCHC-type domain-containing protein n=1 Tax=Hibiscus trionum TaxID=183268 RepID=A0A9W7HBC6_HIBTR|nr:hypothetical protein HRI_001112300 [Hibiscus trionum]
MSSAGLNLPSSGVSGRPPDPAVHVPIQASLECAGAPLGEELERGAKKGRGAVDEVRDEGTPMGDVCMQEAVAGTWMGSEPPVGDQLPVLENAKPSFRDMVAGKDVGREVMEELDVDLLKEDVTVDLEGVLPKINFSERVHESIDAKLSCSVIVRLLGKAIGYRALLNRVRALWVPVGKMELVDLDNEYFLARFELESDYARVLSGGPWVIYGCYLTVQPWSRSFTTVEDYRKQIVVWARLPGLPYRYYTKSMFWAIANVIGKVVRIDYNTLEGKRGRFARFAMVVDLGKPLPSGVMIDGFRQDIEYEGLPMICFACGKYGHQQEMCGKDHTLEGADSVTRPENVGEVQPEKDLYGPWIQVMNRRHRPVKTGKQLDVRERGQQARKESSGSRFGVLGTDGGEKLENVAARGSVGVLARPNQDKGKQAMVIDVEVLTQEVLFMDGAGPSDRRVESVKA